MTISTEKNAVAISDIPSTGIKVLGRRTKPFIYIFPLKGNSFELRTGTSDDTYRKYIITSKGFIIDGEA